MCVLCVCAAVCVPIPRSECRKLHLHAVVGAVYHHQQSGMCVSVVDGSSGCGIVCVDYRVLMFGAPQQFFFLLCSRIFSVRFHIVVYNGGTVHTTHRTLQKFRPEGCVYLIACLSLCEYYTHTVCTHSSSTVNIPCAYTHTRLPQTIIADMVRAVQQ